MSKYLSTLDEKIHIRSMVDGEGFGLSVIHKDKGKVAYEEFSWKEYGPLLKSLWESYFKTGQKPKLAGQILSDDGFVIETLHYIAPGSFTHPCGATLSEDRESFLHWLKSQYNKISARINTDEFQYLDKELDTILSMHLERKKRQDTLTTR